MTDKMKKSAYTLFIAAFDHVNRHLIFKTVYQRLIPTSNAKVIQLTELLYMHTTTGLAQTPNENFELSMGVRQGRPESPPLLNLRMFLVMQVFLDKCTNIGIKFMQLEYRTPLCINHQSTISI